MAPPKKTVAAPAIAAASISPESISLEAIEPIRIDGTDIPPGETFEALPADAEALIASGAAALGQAIAPQALAE